MATVKGYFNESGDSYTLLTPKTRSDYINCLQNNKGYLFEVNHFGAGRTLCRFKFTEQNTIVPEGDLGRTIYFRDDETNDTWCVGGFPYVSEVENFSCTHAPSCTIISSEHNGIKVTIRVFVPVDKQCDIQTVEIENLSGKSRKISVFPAMQLDLTGFKAPRFADNFEQTYITSFKEEINGLYLDGRNPFAYERPYNAFITSTAPVHAFSADDRHVFGSQYSLSQPYAILDGEELDSKSIVAGKLCFVLQNKFEIEPSAKAKTDFVFGISKDYKACKEIVSDLKTVDEVQKMYEKTEKVDFDRRNRLMIDTPDKETNYFVNYWLKTGTERNLIFRNSPRDNLQFADSALHYMPEATRYTIVNAMAQQYNDGHMVRRWVPVVSTYYSDAPAWLVTTACNYIKYTGDVQMLDEVIDYFDYGNDTAWMHLVKGVARLDADRGPHNIPLSRFADWNDALNTGARDEEAESVFVAMQLALVFKEMAELCEYLGKNDLKEVYLKKYDDLKKVINDECWDEEGYYIRSFAGGKPIGSSKSEKGSKIYSNPQSWSIFSGVCPPERLQSVLDSIDKYIYTPLGCRVNYPPYEEADPILGRISFQYPGTSENGAVYAHATGFKMYSDCLLGLGDRGFAAFKTLMPSNPDNPEDVADTIPYAISNVCSTSDVCYGKSSARPFSTGTQSWLFKTIIEGILGLRFAYDGYKIAPAFPSAWDKASVRVEHRGATYNYSIVNNNTGTKKIYVNGKLIDSDYVPFAKEGIVDIKVEL